MDADMQLSCLEALNSVNFREKFSWLISQTKNYGDRNNANRRLKSANSSSKLSNKGCPLICIKDQTIPLWIFQQAGESGPNLQLSAMTTLDMVKGLVRRKISRLPF